MDSPSTEHSTEHSTGFAPGFVCPPGVVFSDYERVFNMMDEGLQRLQISVNNDPRYAAYRVSDQLQVCLPEPYVIVPSPNIKEWMFDETTKDKEIRLQRYAQKRQQKHRR
tara:strand:- start:3455 stop:3784 length:330 start_codon:yes stop_codon:yes gene_type:complete